MSHLARQADLIDVIVRIEVKLYQLGWITVEREGDRRLVELQEDRLLGWAITCCEVGGTIDPQTFRQMLDRLPLAKRWRLARQFLPEDAIRALEGKLSAILEAREIQAPSPD